RGLRLRGSLLFIEEACAPGLSLLRGGDLLRRRALLDGVEVDDARVVALRLDGAGQRRRRRGGARRQRRRCRRRRGRGLRAGARLARARRDLLERGARLAPLRRRGDWSARLAVRRGSAGLILL